MIFVDKLSLAAFLGTSSEVPLQVAQAIISTVKSQRLIRKVDTEKHWAMYQGEHSEYFQSRKDEDAALLAYRKKKAVVVNYVRYVVDLSGKYLYGRASKVSRKFSEKNADTDKRMRDLLKQTQYDLLMLEGCKKAGIFSEIGFRLVPVDSVTGAQPENGVATETTYPHPILLDPSRTFFLVNKWNKVIAVVIQDEYTDYNKGSEGTKHKTLELVVDDSRWFWDDQGDFTFSSAKLASKSKNLYALNEEFVLGKNNDSWTDDVQDILSLNIQMDEVLTDNSHFFARHGWPQLVSSVDLKGVQHSPQHAWEIPSDGPSDKVQDKLFFLQWDGRMEEANNFVQYLESLIFKVSCTARVATGDLEAIGQLRSGPAIVTAHSPSIQKTQEKQVVWGDNEMRLLTAMAALDSKIHGQALQTRYAGLDIVITFPRDFVPGEELVRAEVQQIQMQNHIRTIKDLIRENHPEMSEEQIEEYRTELMGDSRDVVDSEREFLTTDAGGASKEAKPKPSGASGSAKKKSTEQK
jgi:SPP1 Gp6-like portal protein